MSEQTHGGGAVYPAIARVMSALAKEGIAKDRKNASQGYQFRGIDDVYNAVAPHLAEAGLCILPTVESRECTERRAQSGGALFNVVCRVRFDFVAAADGSSHAITTYGEAMDSADKATNKAMSAAYKYACMQAFCIPTEGDNDADATTHAVAPSAPTEAPRAAAPRAAPRAAAPRAAAPANDGGFVFKFGKAKGQPFSSGTDRDLEWYAEALNRSIHDPDKARFQDANRRELAALRAEQDRRAGRSDGDFDPATGEVLNDEQQEMQQDRARAGRMVQEAGADDLPF